MAALPQRVRDEHSELVARIELLRRVADRVGSVSTETLREGVGQAYTFLIHQLIPHAQAEEQVWYPAVGRLLRAVEATETMSRDHLEVIRLTEELEALRLHLFYAPLSEPDEQALRRGPLRSLCDHRAASCEGGGDLSPRARGTINGFGSGALGQGDGEHGR